MFLLGKTNTYVGLGKLCELARIDHMAMKTTGIFQVFEVEENNRSGEQ